MSNTPSMITPKWGPVLTTLYRANKFTSVQEIADLTRQDLDAVQAALVFLRGQGWAEKLADGLEWVCTPAARAVMQSLEKSKVIEQ